MNNDGKGKEPETYTYEKCPVCGSTENMIGYLAAKEEERGVDPRSVPHFLYNWTFLIRDTKRPAIIGTRAPAGSIIVDVCKKCGVVRSTKVEIREAVNMPR